MIYVVKKDSNEILNRCDAWLEDAEKKMRRWVSENGYIPLDIEITMMGDMVIWVF